jgi:hypothetical protein
MISDDNLMQNIEVWDGWGYGVWDENGEWWVIRKTNMLNVGNETTGVLKSSNILLICVMFVFVF